MQHLFVYGSLMFDEVWQRLVKKSYRRIPATLYGFRRFAVRHETYPAITRTATSHVDGILVMNMSRRDLRSLDKFEGNVYTRKHVSVSTGKHSRMPAQTYVIKDRFRKLLARDDWDINQFRDEGLQLFLSRYRNFHR